MVDLWSWVQEQLKTNPVFSGVMGAGFISALLFWSRSRLLQAWAWLRQQFFMELTVYDSDPAFFQLSVWLIDQPRMFQTRSFRIATSRSVVSCSPPATDTADKPKLQWRLTAGPGMHVYWLGWRPLFVTVSEIRKEFGDVQRIISLRAMTRNNQVFLDILMAAQTLCEEEKGVPVFFWRYGSWYRPSTRPGRAWSSVVVDPAIKHDIREMASAFFSRQSWYAARGIPWRSGALLHGPPGTGKTSIALALATELDCVLYVANACDFRSDAELAQAMLSIDKRSIVVMEDIDVARASQTRSRPGPVDASSTTAAVPAHEVQEDRGVTKIGLLNAIDGLAAPEGRFLLLTTNHPERLDPALTRAGRVDKHAEIGPLNARLACQLYGVIWPHSLEDEDEWADKLGEDWSATGADLQACFISYEDAAGLLDELRSLGRIDNAVEEETVVEDENATGWRLVASD